MHYLYYVPLINTLFILTLHISNPTFHGNNSLISLKEENKMGNRKSERSSNEE